MRAKIMDGGGGGLRFYWGGVEGWDRGSRLNFWYLNLKSNCFDRCLGTIVTAHMHGALT